MPASRTSRPKEVVKPCLHGSDIVKKKTTKTKNKTKQKKNKKRSYSYADAEILNLNYFKMNSRNLKQTCVVASKSMKNVCHSSILVKKKQRKKQQQQQQQN